MNFIQLEYFQSVMEQKSVTLAAKKLFVTQPAVSKQIRLLEEELECPLFLRKGNRLAPTAEAEFLYSRIDSLMNDFNSLPAEMNAFRNHVAGKLNIGCGPYTSAAVLPDLILEYVRRYPDVRPSIRENDSFVEELREGRLDIMFGVQKWADCEFRYEPMYRNRLILVCSKRSPLAKARKITPELLLSQPLLAHSYHLGTIFGKLPYLRRNRFFLESRYTATLLAYVRRNLGFSIIPDYNLGSLPADIAVPEFDTGCEVETGFLVRRASVYPPQLRAMIELVFEKYGTEKR